MEPPSEYVPVSQLTGASEAAAHMLPAGHVEHEVEPAYAYSPWPHATGLSAGEMQ